MFTRGKIHLILLWMVCACIFLPGDELDLFSEVETLELPSGRITIYGYDADKRLVGMTDEVGNIDLRYDQNGLLISIKETPAAGGVSEVSTRQYDEDGRLISFTDVLGQTSRYSWDQSGNLIAISYPGGDHTVTYEHDEIGRMMRIRDWAGRETVFSRDHLGRIIHMKFFNGVGRSYRYDSVGRIERVRDEDSKGNLIVQFILQYNSRNKVHRELILPVPTIRHFSADSLAIGAENDLTEWDHLIKSDLSGNLILAPVNGELQELSYDARNRLLSVSNVSYNYDSENRRITKTIGTTTTQYVHSPIGRYYSVLQESTGTDITRYVHGGGLLYEELPNGEVRFYHFDARGSTIAMSDVNATVTHRFTYDSAGTPIAGKMNETTPTFLFNGRWGVITDANGLIIMGTRYFHPAINRFLNEDPYGLDSDPNKPK